MRVSLNTIKQYIDFELPSNDELVARINQQLGGVEEVIDLGERYKDAVIAKVVKCDKHPNADKLSVCEIDADTGENVQVVCGAPNVREGIFVVWLPPGSTVPATFDDKEPFVLEPKELRGVVSNGMLASARELGIGDSHEGILEIDPEEWKPNDVAIKPGVNFAEAYGLDDHLIDIENKMFTHRPDLFGQLGVAREIAGIQHKEFKSPAWYLDIPEFTSAEGLKLDVFNETDGKVPRIMFAVMKNVMVKPSPLWLQCALVAMGGKPINNIVDVTNYTMLLTAQPTHAYDYDKIRGARIGARLSKKGEKITLLNGKTYDLTAEDIVITDGEGPIGLGGIMGGGDSEVDPDTKNIVLEVATFDMYTVRKSSMRHGIFTDALTRFNKGQSPLQNDHVMGLLLASMKDVSPAEQASDVFDMKAELQGDIAVEVTPAFINERLGLDLSADEMATLLRNVEMTVAGELKVTPPFWRTDIELPEDIVEEIGRLYGFDKLPRELPKRSTKPAPKNVERELQQRIRDALSRAGANEVLTYSFVHENIIKKAGQDPSQAYRLSNALSPDLQYYRLSVLPSLLDKVHGNIKAGYDEFALFEIGKTHNKLSDEDVEGLPAETKLLDMVYASKKARQGAAYYQMKRLVMQLLRDLGIEATVKPIEKDVYYAGAAPFDQNRSGIVVTDDDTPLGMIGELKPSVRRSFKLPDYTAAATLDVSSLSTAAASARSSYAALSRFPSVTQDISLKVPAEMPYQTIFTDARSAIEAAVTSDVDVYLQPRSIYRSEKDPSHKVVTLHVRLTNADRTMTEQEASAALAGVPTVTKAELV